MNTTNNSNFSTACFIPEKEIPYPLCIGRNLPQCENCQLWTDYESDDMYGPE